MIQKFTNLNAKTFAFAVFLIAGTNAFSQGFSPSHTQWNIPANTDDGEWKLDDSYSRHNVFDMNGDGKPDLIDSENEATTSVSDVFVNGSQKYWKVYLNNGSGFSATFTQWNIPTNLDDGDWKFFDAYSRHQVMDFNGDGLPDLIDSEDEGTTTVSDVFLNGSQKYWKVYLNTGSGFSSTSIQWNIPSNIDDLDWKLFDSYSRHNVSDINGDGKPDLIDSEDEATTTVSDVFLNGSQKYWKVYLNTGSGFSSTSTQWNIPANIDDLDWKYFDTYSRHSLSDMNGDGKLDLVDSENEGTTTVSDVFLNGSQKYWKVYLNTGSGFSSSASQWNIPSNMDDLDWKFYDTYSRHNVSDMNGDGKPDMVDSEDEGTTTVSDVFLNGSQKYWKVYYNNGSGFSNTHTQWNIPTNIDDGEWKFYDSYSRHQVMDFNGDGAADLIDSENEGTTTVSDVFLNGSQKYWKVYLNTLNTTNILSATLETSNVLLYPNPCVNEFKVKVDAALSDVQVIVINALGETVSAEQNFSNNEITVKLTNLSSGVYFVQLLCQQVKTQQLKLVVNN